MGRGLLITVSGLLIVYGIIQHSVTSRQDVLITRTVDYHEEEHVRNLAGGVAEFALREIQADQDWAPDEDNFPDLAGGSAKIKIYTQDPDGTAPDDLPAGTSVPFWDQYTLLIFTEAEYDGLKAETEVLIQKDSFSKYSYFSHEEMILGSTPIYWYDEDEVSGPVHTNDTFRMSGSPTFHGDVSSPNDWVGYTGDPDSNDPDERHGSDTPQFNGNTNFNEDEIPPPTSYELQPLRESAQSGGLSFNDDICVIFKDNGTVDISERRSYGCDNSVTNYSLSSINGVISSSRRIYTKGTVKGQATIHSEERIEIIGDIRYDTNPLDNPESTDLLGLVSEGEVRVDDDAHRDEGYEDIDIQASIMALDESFIVEDWGSGSPRGTINLLGGIIQIERGPVGTFNSNGTASGFNKNYVYDERLLEQNPPEYPRESRFSIQYWKDRPLTVMDN